MTSSYPGQHVCQHGKRKFCQQNINSIGFQLSDFPTPTTQTELQSFGGLVNQPSSGTNIITKLLAPLNHSSVLFLWTTKHEVAVSKTKQYLTKASLLTFLMSISQSSCVRML